MKRLIRRWNSSSFQRLDGRSTFVSLCGYLALAAAAICLGLIIALLLPWLLPIRSSG